MMTHVVLLKVRPDVEAQQVEAVFAALGALKNKIPGILTFAGGPYSSPEGLNRGFTHGFVMKFSDAAARDVYLDHPEHEKVKGQVLEVLEGGLDGVTAFDFDS
jgi:hypothetical protein